MGARATPIVIAPAAKHALRSLRHVLAASIAIPRNLPRARNEAVTVWAVRLA